MNKIINKALFYKEWINVKYVTILTAAVLLYFKLFSVISMLNSNKFSLRENGKVYTDRWFNNGLYNNETYFFVMVFVMIILSVVIFLGEKNSQTQDFIASMPFTRKEIIINKWFAGVVSIVISFAIAFTALSLFYAANLNYINTALNPYSDIVKWVFIDAVQYICIFTFFLFVQTVMGNSIVASIAGAIILLVPNFIIGIIKSILFMNNHAYGSDIIINLNKASGWLNIYVYNALERFWYTPKENSDGCMTSVYFYHNYEIKFIILIILTMIFLYSAYKCYKKRNLEYNLRLITYKNLEPVFIIGFSICAGFTAGAFLGFGILGQNSIKAFWLFTIIGAAAGYFISKKLVNAFQRSK